jgi:hypothetical protein
MQVVDLGVHFNHTISSLYGRRDVSRDDWMLRSVSFSPDRYETRPFE